jgi:transcriptional regulator with XRE-family HTH domain
MNKMKKKNEAAKELKKKVGERLKLFRLDKKKAQNILASELKVHQSTITNIEQGTTFPKLNYLKYFKEKYALNLNWLVTGEGDKFLDGVEKNFKGSAKIKLHCSGYGDEKYRELSNMMRIPVVEQVMFAKLSECKILFKDEISKFLDNQEKEKRAKKRKASRVKFKK